MRRLIAMVALSLLASEVAALDAAGLVFGKGLNDDLIQSGDIASTEIAGVDLRWHTDWADYFSWAEVDQTYVNVQFAHWSGAHLGRREDMDVAALTALWRWHHDDGWFADAGVGVSRLTDRVYEEVELASRNQFALDFAVGKQLAKNWELSLRYRHYSNGYTKSPNPGLDGAVLLLSYQL